MQVGQEEVPLLLQWCPGALDPVPKQCLLCHLVSGHAPFSGTMTAMVKMIRHEVTRTLWSSLPATWL